MGSKKPVEEVKLDEVTQKAWEERVGKFATDVKKPVDDVAKALEELIGEPGSDALEALADPTACTEDDLISVLKVINIPRAILRKNLQTLRGPKPVVEAPAESPQSALNYDILPQVDNEEAFLKALKTGGKLEEGITTTDITAAVRVALADSAGLFDTPSMISSMMEEYAESLDKPVGPEFYPLLKLVKTRQYADVLTAFDLDKSYITNDRRTRLLGKLRTHIWDEMSDFHKGVTNWVDVYSKGMLNPGMLISQIAQAVTPGANAGGLAQAIMAPPDTSDLLDAAEGFFNKVNKVFSGTMVPVARAMAREAMQIKGILDNAALPRQIGANDRDEMIKKLGVNVSSEYVRLEQNIVRYALAIVDLPKKSPGQAQLNYLLAMWQLGTLINWEKLQRTETPSGRGRNKI